MIDKIKNLFFNYSNNKLVRLAALIVLIYSVFEYGSSDKKGSIFLLLLSSASFATILGALFSDEDRKSKLKADIKMFNWLIEKIAYDQNFSYWLKINALGAPRFSSHFYDKLINHRHNYSENKTMFFYDNFLQKKYLALNEVIIDFAKVFTENTIRKDDINIGIPDSNVTCLSEKEKEEEFAIWEKKVKKLEDASEKLYISYGDFILCAKKRLHI